MHIEWKTIELPLMTDDDPEGKKKTIEGREAIGTGLGYSIFAPDDDEPDALLYYYSVIHVASGYRLHRDPILVEDLAKRMVRAFLPLTDWTAQLDVLIAQEKEVFTKMHEVYLEINTLFYAQLEDERGWTYWGQ